MTPFKVRFPRSMDEAVQVLDIFHKDVGKDVAAAAYAWGERPSYPTSIEHFFLLETEQDPYAGWASLYPWEMSAGKPIFEHSAGIFVEWQGSGLAIPFRTTVVHHAFQHLNAKAVVRCIMHSNAEYAARCRERALQGRDWMLSGRIERPSWKAQDIYIMPREEWYDGWLPSPPPEPVAHARSRRG